MSPVPPIRTSVLVRNSHGYAMRHVWCVPFVQPRVGSVPDRVRHPQWGHDGSWLLPTFEIAATMGTSLEQLSATYAHLLPDSADRARATLDAYLGSRATAARADA